MTKGQGTNFSFIQDIYLFKERHLELEKCFCTKNLGKLPCFFQNTIIRDWDQINFWTLTSLYDSSILLSIYSVGTDCVIEQNRVSPSFCSWKSSDGTEGQQMGGVFHLLSLCDVIHCSNYRAILWLQITMSSSSFPATPSVSEQRHVLGRCKDV